MGHLRQKPKRGGLYNPDKSAPSFRLQYLSFYSVTRYLRSKLRGVPCALYKGKYFWRYY